MVSSYQQIENDCLIGIGHPLLDISIHVDEKFLSIYNLKADDAILSEPHHKNLIEHCFKNFNNQIKLIAGGATQNSIRTAQWVFNFFKMKKTFFLGAVGDDENASMLEQQAKKDNVETLYCKVKANSVNQNNNLEYFEKFNLVKNGENHTKNLKIFNQQIESKENELDSIKTGVCLAFNTQVLSGKWRSMITFLGAARLLNVSHLDDHIDKLMRCSLFYCGGFMLSSSFDVVAKISRLCQKSNKKFALNLSAPYICSNFGNLIAQLIPNLDLIFGNEKEFREFANYHHFKTNDLPTIAMKIFDMFSCQKYEQLIIITQNKDAVLCFVRSTRAILEQYVPIIDKNEIVDTIGAGDAFVGGFMAYYLLKKDLDLCLKCGIYCARQIIKKTGCNFDDILFNEQRVLDLFSTK